jgi:polysaccharide deacetylase family sporulation protein PdaB
LTVRGRVWINTAALLAAVTIAVLSLTFPTFSAAYAGYTMRRLPIYSVDTPEKAIALTFDAAWGADKTEKILEILNANGIKATFFLVGFWIDKYIDEVKMLDNAGIEIGNHTENHPDMAKLTAEQMKKELLSVNDKLKAATGKDTRFFRPPFGSYNDRLIGVSAELGLTVIQWDVDSLDWKDTRTSSIVDRVSKKVRNGSIILFHNNSDCVTDAIGILIPKLLREGYRFVTVGELVRTENYRIDHTGRQFAA